jgi:hypothetical protein
LPSRFASAQQRKENAMEWVFAGLGAILYLVVLVTLGVMTLRGGHIVMFVIGFFFPLFWLIGAFIAPTEAARRPGPAPTSP